jgi:hypothetical protein
MAGGTWHWLELLAMRRCRRPDDVADLVSAVFVEPPRAMTRATKKRGHGCSISPLAVSPTAGGLNIVVIT